MDHAVTHRSNMDPGMSTTNRGSIMPQGDSNMEQGPGRAGRKSYVEPSDFLPGPNMHVGVGAREAVNKWDGQFHDDQEMMMVPEHDGPPC